MEEYTKPDELYHYGRKGMKWHQHIFGSDKNNVGARKNKKKSSELDRLKQKAAERYKAKSAEKQKTKEEKKKKAEDEAREKVETKARVKADMKSVKKMSDSELATRIKRLEMEKDYKSLLQNTSTIHKGKAFVARVIEKSGEELAIQVTKHVGAKGLNKVFGEEVIFANNKKKG